MSLIRWIGEVMNITTFAALKNATLLLPLKVEIAKSSQSNRTQKYIAFRFTKLYLLSSDISNTVFGIDSIKRPAL